MKGTVCSFLVHSKDIKIYFPRGNFLYFKMINHHFCILRLTCNLVFNQEEVGLNSTVEIVGFQLPSAIAKLSKEQSNSKSCPTLCHVRSIAKCFFFFVRLKFKSENSSAKFLICLRAPEMVVVVD